MFVFKDSNRYNMDLSSVKIEDWSLGFCLKSITLHFNFCVLLQSLCVVCMTCVMP